MNKMTNLEQVLALRNRLTGEPGKYLERYLENAPMWLLESLQVITLEKDTIIVRENMLVDRIFILAEGIVRAVDYRIFGIAYDYMWFYPIKVFGAMELLLEFEQYRTTLQTVSDCTLMVLPRNQYEDWMKNDTDILLMEAKMMGTYLLEQARKERTFLFTQGSDRLMLLFLQLYEQHAIKGHLVLRLTRQELADRSGLSVKTINRSVAKLREEGRIGKGGNHITVTAKQYQGMKEYITPIINFEA